MPPLIFEPFGPFEIPVRRLAHGRLIAPDDELKEWWADLDYDRRDHNDLAESRGVFVFAMQTSKGAMPYYVGKTSRQDFGHECFSAHKRNKYNHVVAMRAGTPVLMLLAHPRRRGPIHHAAIDGLELELINMAYERNPEELMNERRIEDLAIYSVAGALRAGRGKPSSDALALRRILGME